MNKQRMGRGLNALLGPGNEEDGTATGPRSHIAVEAIDENPHQPRKSFDEEELAALGDSIRTHGILQPILVRQMGERFQLIAGERRLRAARSVGMKAVPVTVVNLNDQQVLEAALVENLQRSDLNPIEKARGFKDYLERFAMTHEQLANRLGLGRATITNLVSLLDLPDPLQDAVRVGQLSTGHAKVLKGISDPARQIALGKEITARGLSVHASEALVKQGSIPEVPSTDSQEPPPPREASKEPVERTAHVQSIEEELRQKLGLKVEIKLKAKDRGQVVLSFESNDDFERVVEVLRR
jgi:ParB family chromosome partitioning protein